jgi:hypothetical protein
MSLITISFYNTYDTEILDAPTLSQTLIPKTTVKREPDFQKYNPYLAGFLLISSRKLLNIQHSSLPTATMLKKTFRSPNPALNIYRRNEDVACDIVYSNVPAIFDGSTAAVIFVGTSTKVTDVHGIKKDNKFANTLEDNIIQRGAPNCILSDRGTEVKLLLVTNSKISFEPFVLRVGKVNLINTIRTPLNNGTRP